MSRFPWYLSVLLGGWLLCGPVAGAATAEIDGETLLDPTRPMGAGMVREETGDGQSGLAGSGPTRYRVSFIRAGGDTPTAVVNDQVVSVGDEVNGAEVLSIERGAVRLRIDDGETVVSAWGGSVRETADE